MCDNLKEASATHVVEQAEGGLKTPRLVAGLADLQHEVVYPLWGCCAKPTRWALVTLIRSRGNMYENQLVLSQIGKAGKAAELLCLAGRQSR